mmetsp:Transcript_46454/g.88697  ORF Transcript_46454/g.88697 Transcript_46454/m.88697 type:complete len:97 (-) Transcript_46454:173-463(-)|eukprot:CAMPEP_0114257074 /NCGR_PEP_ID=MMETSP0058-20121206/18521_1 /TAXON_ID=36894 /ORGANISM="Pyramimonas parkeae, CCMP726" /LENGTH=96 /DNA_ID=CAMNT_0001371741 /DNA_START=53 /DNA_END=343 /DNA_ORIENTATION=+
MAMTMHLSAKSAICGLRLETPIKSAGSPRVAITTTAFFGKKKDDSAAKGKKVGKPAPKAKAPVAKKGKATQGKLKGGNWLDRLLPGREVDGVRNTF